MASDFVNRYCQQQTDEGTQMEADTFSPENYVINIVKRAIANKQNIRIDGKQLGSMTVLGMHGEYYPLLDDMAIFCKAPVSAFKVTVLENIDFDRELKLYGRNIDELMWHAAFHASDGRLMEGCQRDDVVELAYWPNLSRLPSTPNSMRLAALLTRYPTSIALAHRFLRIDQSEAYQFYSAARCAGLARSLNRTPVEPSLKPHRNQALLGLLLDKIAGI